MQLLVLYLYGSVRREKVESKSLVYAVESCKYCIYAHSNCIFTSRKVVSKQRCDLNLWFCIAKNLHTLLYCVSEKNGVVLFWLHICFQCRATVNMQAVSVCYFITSGNVQFLLPI